MNKGPGMGVRKRALSLRSGMPLTILWCIGFLLFFAPSSALAVEHSLLEIFGSAEEPTFMTPAGMAVDQSTGDVVVIDAGDATLKRYYEDRGSSDFGCECW